MAALPLFRHAALPFLLLSLAACSRQAADAPLTVSVIGPEPRIAPALPAATAPEAALAGATGLGLLRLDASGQVEPGLALRWAIEGDGSDVIFRLDDARAIAPRLKRLLHRDRSPLAVAIDADMDALEPVTHSVIELGMGSPRPELLPLLASPRFGALSPQGGPYRAEAGPPGTIRLLPRRGSDAVAPVLLRGERAGRAVLRFARGDSDAVLGGSFADFPLTKLVELPHNTLRVDEATGLFGFAIRAGMHADKSPLADPAIQEALAIAIDRDRILARIDAKGLAKATTVSGSTVELPLPDRRVRARGLLGRLEGAPLAIRVALPKGPAMAMLFRLVADDWAQVGVTATREADPERADLVLIDETVPAGERARVACAAAAGCDARNPLALLRPPFVPILAPLRWSLVSPHLKGFTANPLAAHPLDQLR